MGLFGPGKPDANHTQAELTKRQEAAKKEDRQQAGKAAGRDRRSV